MLALFADTGTLRAHGAAYAAHADDLAALAAALQSLPSQLRALGPVADRFVADFVDALTSVTNDVGALRESAQRAGMTVCHNASSYEVAGHRAAALFA
jgi:HPt (histidine-containing phosphotransfer) domain-containing protein